MLALLFWPLRRFLSNRFDLYLSLEPRCRFNATYIMIVRHSLPVSAFHGSVVFPFHPEDLGMSSTSIVLCPHPGTQDLRLARRSSQHECVPFYPRGPGSTLHRFYSAGGQFLEENANRMAYKLGMGPHAVCQRIQAFFGDGPEREAKLDELKHNEIPLVKKWCLHLMKYVLPCVIN
jgi:hypothetical protein